MAELPKTSMDVAVETYKEVSSDPNTFIRAETISLGQDNPIIIDRTLRGVIGMTLLISPKAAKTMLEGCLYRYACSKRELERKGNTMPFVPEEAAEEAGVELAQINDEIALRQIGMRLEREDPLLGGIVRSLLQQPTTPPQKDRLGNFIRGLFTMHLTLSHTPSDAAPLESIPEEECEFVIPKVRRSIARNALVEMIIDNKGLKKYTKDKLLQFSPDLVNMIVGIHYAQVPHPELYELVAWYEMYCLIREFSVRDIQFPHVDFSHKDAPIADTEARASQLAYLDEIGSTNPHLYWGLSTFLDPFRGLRGDFLAAGISGVSHPYSLVKNALS